MTKDELNETFWTNRYLNHTTGWDCGVATPPIAEYFDKISNKSASILIPGCGNAHEADYLLNAGFNNITLLDISQVALNNFKSEHPNFPSEKCVHGNFFEYQGSYDFIVEQTFFCALHPSLRVNYVEKMYELLGPTGKLIGVLFNEALNSDKPPFGGSEIEYQNLFQPVFQENFTLQPCYNSIAPRANRELFLQAWR